VNKAFTKEDETSEPPIVRARAPLPAGTPNYVTARGLQRLKAELRDLDEERAKLDEAAPEKERAHALASLAARKSALEERIASAQLVETSATSRDEIRFGARVEVCTSTGASRIYQIVGVDEAQPATGLVAFVSPVARALLGRQVGDSVTVKTPRGEEELEVVRIDYDEPLDTLRS
jgi:transcription elongation factor GreB